jgi:hypothetical protein
MRSRDMSRRNDTVARLILIPKLPTPAPMKTVNLRYGKSPIKVSKLLSTDAWVT